MKKKPDKTISEEDKALFRQAVTGTRRLKQDNVVERHRPAPAPQSRPQHATAETSFQDLLSDDMEMEQVGAAEELQFQRPGLQNTLLRKLRRGQIPIEAELDLHGMRIADARGSIARFLENSAQQGLRCVHIVHGKGYGSSQDMPVLKNKLNSWLRQRSEVLAFCSARPIDGGTGAVYILLKNQLPR